MIRFCLSQKLLGYEKLLNKKCGKYENKHIKVIVESIASGKLCIGMGVDNKNEQEENSFTLLFRAKRQLLYRVLAIKSGDLL